MVKENIGEKSIHESNTARSDITPGRDVPGTKNHLDQSFAPLRKADNRSNERHRLMAGKRPGRDDWWP